MLIVCLKKIQFDGLPMLRSIQMPLQTCTFSEVYILKAQGIKKYVRTTYLELSNGQNLEFGGSRQQYHKPNSIMITASNR